MADLPPTPVLVFWRHFAQGIGLGAIGGGFIVALGAALLHNNWLSLFGVTAFVLGWANYIVWRWNDV